MVYVGSTAMKACRSQCAGGDANGSGGYSGREADVASDTDKATLANDLTKLRISRYPFHPVKEILRSARAGKRRVGVTGTKF